MTRSRLKNKANKSGKKEDLKAYKKQRNLVLKVNRKANKNFLKSFISTNDKKKNNNFWKLYITKTLNIPEWVKPPQKGLTFQNVDIILDTFSNHPSVI